MKNTTFDSKPIFKAFLLIVVAGLVLVWFFYGSIHPCEVLGARAKNDLGTLDGVIAQEYFKTLSPAECSGILIRSFADPNAIRRELNDAIRREMENFDRQMDQMQREMEESWER